MNPPYSKNLKELSDKLTDIAATGGVKQSVKIQGDSGLKWRGVVKVMDACRNAGFENISFAAAGRLRDLYRTELEDNAGRGRGRR